METLVHVSSALQRERTALMLMQQILVDQRDELRLGQLVPVGDLFDAIADGEDQPFTEKLKHEFDQARTLYQRTCAPCGWTTRVCPRSRSPTAEAVAGCCRLPGRRPAGQDAAAGRSRAGRAVVAWHDRTPARRRSTTAPSPP